jgi:hypothetical protein
MAPAKRKLELSQPSVHGAAREEQSGVDGGGQRVIPIMRDKRGVDKGDLRRKVLLKGKELFVCTTVPHCNSN